MRYRDMAKPRFHKGTSRRIRQAVAGVIEQLEREQGEAFTIKATEAAEMALVSGTGTAVITWRPDEVHVELVEPAV